MSVFQKYASCYDALYLDKNYQLEVDYIQSLIQKNSVNAKNILDLGCGTGKHAALLSEKGYDIQGIDLSNEMIELAKKNFASEKLSFSCSDMRDFKIDKKVDVILSLFHVMSYLTADDDLTKTFSSVNKHLKKDGIFIFDCWYGPAVLNDKPTLRVKRLKKDDFEITRIAEPEMHANDNVVDVNYQIFIKDTQKKLIEDFKETHRMRYLFDNEIQKFLLDNGFNLILCEEWLTGKKPTKDSWGVTFICKKCD
ncbi:class I SAM-dependent methyltransferase [Candidatus Babeliales bacterium]|nr:class I SAM-dependent methyltransferase [Candidatus Babeliales bacterium]